jgi:hypothetical protein
VVAARRATLAPAATAAGSARSLAHSA